MASIVALVPKFVVSGGNHEVDRLMLDLKRRTGYEVTIIALYPKEASPLIALIASPFFTARAIINILKLRPSMLLLTHYTTLPYSLLRFVGIFKVAVFIQAFEWLFISPNAIVQYFAKAYHLLFYLSIDCFVYANRYLEDNFPPCAKRPRPWGGRPSQTLYPVGAKPQTCGFINSRNGIGCILRNGWIKNESMYYDVFSVLIADELLDPSDISAINMLNSSASAAKYSDLGIQLHPAKSPAEVSCWMASIKIYVCLSIHEGFGLPPLEAMANGAVPLVLMNGGCTAYMDPFPELILASRSSAEDIAEKMSWILSWQDKQLNNCRKRLKEHAAAYFSWAEDFRNTSLAEIVDV
jgi:hypothetical protein